MIGVIAVLSVAVLFLGYKTYDYRTNLKKGKENYNWKRQDYKTKGWSFSKRNEIALWSYNESYLCL